MRGRKSVHAALGIIFLCITACFLFGAWLAGQAEKESRIFHHELAADADSSLGPQEIPEDYTVDQGFVTHLPLIIIDTLGGEIVNYKSYDAEQDAYVYQEGVELYSPVYMSVIDNENHVNSLADAPVFQTDAAMKIRGNSSSRLPKVQYRVKLLDETGNKIKYPMLGMENGSEWILNGTQTDPSYMRNYTAMNLGGTLLPGTPDMRYCEVVKKNGDNKYEYMGLYILYETIDRGVGRIDIDAYDPQAQETSYILRRDRYDNTKTMLYTYATTEGYTDTWLQVLYPKDDKITEKTTAQITEEIDTVERVLYSEERSVFSTYMKYLDVDSFVDYFVINEFFGNYDAGEHSTYLYKEAGGKIKMAALWDYDMSLNNWNGGLFDIEYASFVDRPWFNRLILDDYFAERVAKRYYELRKGIFSDESVKGFINSTEKFLGNALLRDKSRWEDVHVSNMKPIEEKQSGLMVDRRKDTPHEEIQRLEDMIMLHAHYLDKHIFETRYFMTTSEDNIEGFAYIDVIAVLFFIVFFLSTILVQRHRQS